MPTEVNFNRLYQQQVEHNKFMSRYFRDELAKARLVIQVLAEKIRKINFLNQN